MKRRDTKIGVTLTLTSQEYQYIAFLIRCGINDRLAGDTDDYDRAAISTAAKAGIEPII